MPKTVKQTMYGANLDVTGYPLTGIKLMEQIVQDVKDTQMFANRHLPDKLYLTQDQYESLEDKLQMDKEYGLTFLVTKLNVMEVHVAK